MKEKNSTQLPDKLVKLPVVLDAYQVSKAQFYKELADGRFPFKPIKRGHSTFYSLNAVNDFVESIKAEAK